MADEAEPLGVIIFAGPNGSGKSSIKKSLDMSSYTGEYINADDIAKTLQDQIPDRQTRELRAAQEADQRRQNAIAEKRPFAFETVMSTPEKLAIMTQAKASGYEVALLFITLADADMNVQRVADRTAKGGHPVPEEKIRSRYESAMNYLPAAVEHADTAQIYDNSKSHEVMVAAKFDGVLRLEPNALQVPWVASRLWEPHQERQASLAAMRTTYQADVQKNPTALPCVLKTADASHGKRYTGEIVGVTDKHMLQRIGANVYVIHDRAMLPPTIITPRRAQTLEYAYQAGKIATPSITKNIGQDRTR